MGMPRLRQAYVPQPVVDRSAADLRAYIEGEDPISRRPFMQEVLDGLLTPLDEADLQGLSCERTTPRLIEPDTEDNLRRLFEENHWTDSLPTVLPDEARGGAALTGARPPRRPRPGASSRRPGGASRRCSRGRVIRRTRSSGGSARPHSASTGNSRWR